MVEVRIGISRSPKELVLEMDEEVDEIARKLDEDLKKEQSFIWLTDRRQRKVGIPTDRVAYVELLPEGGRGHVGFSLAASESSADK